MPPLLLASGGGGGGTTPVPTLPSLADPTTGYAAAYIANLSAGPTGKDTYRPWSMALLQSIPFFANGWDNPWRYDVDDAAFYDMGSTAPTTFSVADSSSGSTHAAGTVFVYYLVFRNSAIGKETSPQQTSGVPGVTHTMTGTKDVTITWTDPGGEFDKVRIYRRLQNSDNFKLVATVTASTATYDDSSTDATLETATDYVIRYRATKPPVFKGLAAYLNHIVGWTGLDAKLHFSQQDRIDGEFVLDDFPDVGTHVLLVAPNDGFGEIVAVVPHYASLFVFKRRAVYEVQGDSVETFIVRPLFTDRGCVARRSVVAIESAMVFLDERGVFVWTPGAEPNIAGARLGSKESPLSPIWARLNLDAADLFYAIHNEEDQQYEVHVALDHDPVPLYRIVYSYADNQFVSVDTLVAGTAGGHVFDSEQRAHRCRADDLGFLWENDIGNSEGVFDGDTTATLTSGGFTTLVDTGAAFDAGIDGLDGAPYELYNASLTLIDQNRILECSSTTDALYLYFSTTTPAAGHSASFGVIQFRARTGNLKFGTEAKKWVQRLHIAHEKVTSGALKVQAARNEESLSTVTPAAGLSLTSTNRGIVAVDQSGWTWNFEMSAVLPGYDVTIHGVEVVVRAVGSDRK